MVIKTIHWNWHLTGAILKEIRGQGTFELKDFTLLRAAADLNLHQLIAYKNKLQITAGLQIESTSRGGLEVEQADLNSSLVEAGIEAELFPDFSVLVGGKFLSADGSDYIPQITEFNDVNDFPARYTADDSEQLIGAGIKYVFKKDIYLTLQYQSYTNETGTDAAAHYDLNQIFALYSMKF